MGSANTDEKLDTIVRLLQHLLALQLAEKGVKQSEISKHLRVANATVGKLLKGAKHAA
jgi:hypothetical protein